MPTAVGARRAGFGIAALAVATVVSAPALGFAVTPTPNPGRRGSSIGLRLVDAPVSARDDPRARVYIVDHLAPGTVIRRRVEVSNTTRASVHLDLYAAAASIAHGSFLGAGGHTANELSSWTSISPAKPDVPAGGTAIATVIIKVPRDAAPGERYGAVWAEARSAPAAGGGVVQVSRVGIRLYLSIGPGGPPAAQFTLDSLTARRSPTGEPVVLASVHNTGGRALDMSGTLQLLAGPGGLKAGPFPATLGTTVGIGDTEPVTVTLDKQLPAGPWNARISLHSGLLEHTTQATVTFPAAGASPPPAAAASSPPTTTAARHTSSRLPIIITIAVAVVLLAAGAGLARARRRRHRAAAAEPARASRSRHRAA